MRQGHRQRDTIAVGVAVAIATLGNLAGGHAEPATAAGPTPSTMAAVPYWQAPALPAAVIQGGPIPPGWQPQAVPYQGIGPDGRPLTMYFAPTYVFTYQSGPPVAVPPAVARPQAWGATPAATGGWNYSTSGAQPVPVTLPPAPAAGWGR